MLTRLEAIAQVDATRFTEKLFSSGSVLTAKPAAQVAGQVANQSTATVDDKNTIDVQARPKS